MAEECVTRLASIHVDMAGSLPVCEGQRYHLTVVDKFTRWPKAIPIEDMTAKTVTKVLIRNWISQYGVPADIAVDSGRQFTSNLWR